MKTTVLWALPLLLLMAPSPPSMITAQTPAPPKVERSVLVPAAPQLVAKDGLAIQGPAEVRPGSLIVMQCNATQQANVVWFLGNSDEAFLPILNGTSHQCVFATGQEGTYRFIAVAALCVDGKVLQEKAEHSVLVGKPNPPKPDPDKPDPPKPDPDKPDPPKPDQLPTEFDGIATKVYEWASAVAQDSRGAARDLAGIYAKAAEDLETGKLLQIPDAAKYVTEETNKVLVGDKNTAWKTFGGNLNKDFSGQWPLTRQEVSDYFMCVSKGLLAAAP